MNPAIIVSPNTGMKCCGTPETPPVDAWVDEQLGHHRPIEIPWDSMRNRPLSLREKQAVRQFYSGGYAVESNYTASHPWHQDIASWRLAIAQIVLGDLGKVLDCGCSAGEVVRVARANGINCKGFDICPDLFDVCYQEVSSHLRIGSLMHVPYSASDNFKTAISYDVIEHAPIDELEMFPDELKRLGVLQLACIISTDTLSEGHITIQDTDYYRKLFASAGYRLLDEFTEALEETPGPAAWNQQTQEVIWAQYSLSGSPRNGWNQAPGYLLFRREG